MAKWYYRDPEVSEISENDYLTRRQIEDVMERFVTDMSTSHWYGSNDGISANNIDDVAEAIMTELGLWEKKDGL